MGPMEATDWPIMAAFCDDLKADFLAIKNTVSNWVPLSKNFNPESSSSSKGLVNGVGLGAVVSETKSKSQHRLHKVESILKRKHRSSAESSSSAVDSGEEEELRKTCSRKPRQTTDPLTILLNRKNKRKP